MLLAFSYKVSTYVVPTLCQACSPCSTPIGSCLEGGTRWALAPLPTPPVGRLGGRKGRKDPGAKASSEVREARQAIRKSRGTYKQRQCLHGTYGDKGWLLQGHGGPCPLPLGSEVLSIHSPSVHLRASCSVWGPEGSSRGRAVLHTGGSPGAFSTGAKGA